MTTEPMKLGERLTLKDGTVLVAVNKFQRRQTLGWWVGGEDDGDKSSLEKRSDLWRVIDDDFEHELCLCPADELDQPLTTEDKIEALLEGALGWTEAEFKALAMAALDQGGVSARDQKRVAETIGICVDCSLVEATHTKRCDLCADLHDDERREMARDMAVDRRVDEARGK